MPIDNPYNEARSLARANWTHTKEDVIKGEALAEGLKVLMRKKREDLIEAAEGGLVLMTFSSDGTPLTAKVRSSFQIGDKKHRRSGSQSSEYLVQLACYRTINMLNEVISTAFIKEPLPLTKGGRC